MSTTAEVNDTTKVSFIPSHKPTAAERRFFSKLEMLECDGLKVTKEYTPATSCFGEKLTITASVSSHPGSDYGCFMAWTLVRPFGGEICTKRTALSFYGMGFRKGHPKISEQEAMRIYSICKLGWK